MRAIAIAAVAILLGSMFGFVSPATAATGASISGTVSAPVGISLAEADVEVRAYTEADYPWAAGRSKVAADGTYTIAGLEPGTYKVSFVARNHLAWEWWNDKTAMGEASTIALTAGQTRAGINAALVREARITGKITYPAGTDTADVFTTAYAYSVVDSAHYAASGDVEEDGSFEISALRPGVYKILYSTHDYSDRANNNIVQTQWHGGAYDFSSAATVTVTAPGGSTALTHTLSSGRVISGTITGIRPPASYLRVGAHNGENEGYASTDARGNYTIRGLVPGKYTVSFDLNYGTNGETSSSERREWWQDKHSQPTATIIDLTSAASRTGVDADLDTIAGKPTAPSVTGTPVVGGTVKASPGAWPNVELSYRWLADGTPVPRATAATLKIPGSLAGKRVSVEVFAMTEANFWQVRSSATTERILTVGSPAVSGAAAVGATLLVKPGAWTSGTRFTYQWYAAGKAIKGATKSTLVLGTTHAGTAITAKVTGTKSGFTTGAATSKATLKVARTATPTISGTASVGKRLTAKPGTWTSGSRFSYQWYASGKAIVGATKSTLTLTKSHKAKTITVKVTGTKSGYTTVAKTSAKTRAVR
ncbi:hypothetical protein GCM10027071_23210 [Microbacterium marinum]